MSEINTERINGSRSFEEQVFARFDAVDRRFDGIEVRIERLEMKQLDTKPIWEQALIAIAETNAAMRNGFAIVGNAIDQINARLDVMDKRFDNVDARFEAIDKRFDGVDAGFETLSTELNDGLRGVERKIEVLNQDLLELKADQRYVDSRLQKIESGSKPS
ncbi:MAG TPA: hypothetical protein VLB68_30135 [Pyrinomonadaceae bacterium]|nr:hypothetical protein [Pyrinomonadaceae bacterium]